MTGWNHSVWPSQLKALLSQLEDSARVGNMRMWDFLTEMWCSMRVGREHRKGGKFAWEWRWPMKDIQLQRFCMTKKIVNITWKEPIPFNGLKFNTLSMSLSISLFLGGHQLPLEPYFSELGSACILLSHTLLETKLWMFLMSLKVRIFPFP